MDKQLKTIKDKRLKQFVNSGDCDRATRLETLAYLLHSIAQQATEEAAELLLKHGLRNGEVKYRSSFLVKAFNQYHIEVKQMLPRFGSTAFCEDYEQLRKSLYVFAGLETKEANPSECSAANNDQIPFGHIPDNDKN